MRILYFLLVSNMFLFACGSSQPKKESPKNISTENKNRFVFNPDSFEYYYQQDLESIEPTFEKSYQNLSNKILVDSALILFKNRLIDDVKPVLSCDLLKLGIKRMHPEAIRLYGIYLDPKNGSPICNCNCINADYKTFLYLYKAAELVPEKYFFDLAMFFSRRGMERRKIEFYKEGSKHGDKNATRELYTYYRDDFFGGGNKNAYHKNKKLGDFYLQRAIELKEPFTLYVIAQKLNNKANKTQTDKDSICKLITEVQEITKKDIDNYLDLHIFSVGLLSRNCPEIYKKYQTMF